MQNKIETSIPIVIISSDPDSLLFKMFVFINSHKAWLDLL